MDRRKLQKIILEELTGPRKVRRLTLSEALGDAGHKFLMRFEDGIFVHDNSRMFEQASLDPNMGGESGYEDVSVPQPAKYPATTAAADAVTTDAEDEATISDSPEALGLEPEEPGPPAPTTPAATTADPTTADTSPVVPSTTPAASTPPVPASDPLVGALIAGAEADETARRGTTPAPGTTAVRAPVDTGGAADPDIAPAGVVADPEDISDGDSDGVEAVDFDAGPDVSSDDSDGAEAEEPTVPSSEEPTDDEVASMIDYIDSVAVDEVPAGAADLAESRKSRKRLSLAFLLYND